MAEKTNEELDAELQHYEEESEEVYTLLKRCGDKGVSANVVELYCFLTRHVAWLILDGLERAGRIERVGEYYRAKERERA